MHYFIVLFTFCMSMLCTYSFATCSCSHPTGQPCSGWAPSGLWVPRSGVKQSDRPILWVSHLLLPDQNVLGVCVGVKVWILVFVWPSYWRSFPVNIFADLLLGFCSDNYDGSECRKMVIKNFSTACVHRCFCPGGASFTVRQLSVCVCHGSAHGTGVCNEGQWVGTTARWVSSWWPAALILHARTVLVVGWFCGESFLWINCTATGVWALWDVCSPY